MIDVPPVVLAVHAALDRAGIPHAFGGAIALAYAIPDPRATIDVDVNVFVDVAKVAEVFPALPPEVRWTDDDVALARRDGQVRVFHGEVAVDLFFDYHPFHEHAAAHALEVPFGDVPIKVLAPDDLAVFKAFFDRPKDWVDIGEMLIAGSLDLDAVLGWLERLLGPDEPRLDRLRALAAAPPPDDAPKRLPPLP